MFQITVDDVLVARNNVLISGKCVNRDDLPKKLVDDTGAEYSVYIPFIKYLTPPDLDYITLELKGAENPNAMKGRVLRGI
jgi:hypothetical protein